MPADQVKAMELIRRSAEKGNAEGGISYIELVLNEPGNFNQDQLADVNKICRDILAKEPENSDAYYFLGIMLE